MIFAVIVHSHLDIKQAVTSSRVNTRGAEGECLGVDVQEQLNEGSGSQTHDPGSCTTNDLGEDRNPSPHGGRLCGRE